MKRLSLTAAMLLMLSLAAANQAHAGVWQRLADMPVPQNCLGATAVVDGQLYLMPQWAGFDVGIVDTPYRYDPAADAWSPLAPIPVPRFVYGTAAVDGRIYVIGGTNTQIMLGLSTVHMYDPATDTWTRKADMPSARQSLETPPSVPIHKVPLPQPTAGSATGARASAVTRLCARPSSCV